MTDDLQWVTGARKRVELPEQIVGLDDHARRDLCVEILEELGAEGTREDSRGELTHGCLLPFSNHSDQSHNPTASLNYEKLAYACVGSCASGGGLLWLVATVLDLDYHEARQWLIDRSGLEDDEASLQALLSYFDRLYDAATDPAAPMPRYGEQVLAPWEGRADGLAPFVAERCLPGEVVQRFRLGYDPSHPVGPPDRRVWSRRIIIPHFWKGDLVGWQTRRLDDDGTPKYKNSVDFPKDRTLYNYTEGGHALVVESPLSVLRHAHINPWIEATFGAKVTDNQVGHLSRHERVTLWMDNDEAGWKATERLIEALTPYLPVFVVPSDLDADPADLDEVTFTDMLCSRIPASLWTPPATLRAWG